MRYLTKRANSNNYYVRVPIPGERQAALGKREIWKSLGTPDRKLAQKKAFRAVSEIQQEIHGNDATSGGAQVLVDPSIEQMKRAAHEFYNIMVEDDLGERAHSPESFKESWSPKGNKRWLKTLKEQFAVGDFSEIDTDYWSLVFGFKHEPGTPKDRQFAQLLMRALLEAQRRSIEHDRAKFDGKAKDKLFRAPLVPVSAVHTRPPAPTPAEPTLLELFERHRSNLASRLRPDTLVQREKPVRRFAEYVGETTPPSQITKAQARDWRDALRTWPVMADQRKDFAGLDFNGVLEKNKKLAIKPITERSVAKYVSEVSAVFRWLAKEDYVDTNVFDGLHVNAPRDRSDRTPFSDDQMGTLFSSPLFMGCAGTQGRQVAQPGSHKINDWRFWLPVLAAFTGARQGELAQLEVADVKERHGIHFLHITNRGEDPDKAVKNKFSIRSVPLNATVIELGFLEHVAAVRTTGAGRVFPDAKRDTRGAFSTVSKFYQAYFRSIGLGRGDDNTSVFHSFRHRFTDELRQNYPQEWIQPLLGHSGRNVTSGYGEHEALSLQKRYEMIRTIKFGMVDWTKLNRAGPA